MKLTDKIKDIKNEIEELDKQIDQDKWVAYNYKDIRRYL